MLGRPHGGLTGANVVVGVDGSLGVVAILLDPDRNWASVVGQGGAVVQAARTATDTPSRTGVVGVRCAPKEGAGVVATHCAGLVAAKRA
jgi:hypothetical protein